MIGDDMAFTDGTFDRPRSDGSVLEPFHAGNLCRKRNGRWMVVTLAPRAAVTPQPVDERFCASAPIDRNYTHSPKRCDTTRHGCSRSECASRCPAKTAHTRQGGWFVGAPDVRGAR
jgi:hypothetical protein